MSSFIIFKVMWKATVFFFIWSLASASSADEPVGPYRKLGSTVVIPAGPVTGPVTSITWKHGRDIAAEWFGDEVSCFRQFKGRCELDMTTGSLTIRGVTREDRGVYTPEISNVERTPTEIQVIAPVPTPTVTKRCNDDNTRCVLTCEGDITHAEPVEYFWFSNDTEVSGSKELEITKDKETEFGCSLKNPVSYKRSEKIPNPLLSGGNGIYALFLLLLLPPIGFLIYRYRQKIGKKLNLGPAAPHEKVELNPAASGTGPADRVAVDENTPMDTIAIETGGSNTNSPNGEANEQKQPSTVPPDTSTRTDSETAEPDVNETSD